METPTENAGDLQEPECRVVPPEFLTGEKPYIAKSGRVLSPAMVKTLGNLRKNPPKGPGRPKGPSCVVTLERILGKKLRHLLPEDARAKPNFAAWDQKVLVKVMEAIVKAALKGDMRAAEIILDRIDGPVSTRLAGHDGGPLSLDANRQIVNLYMARPDLRAHIEAIAEAQIEADKPPELDTPREAKP
jgi:hypothetical protein